MRINPVPMGLTVVKDFVIVDPTTGAASTATSIAGFIYEDDSTTAMSATVTVAERSGHTGNYYLTVALTEANGFEVGKSYNAVIEVTIGGITSTGVVATFVLGHRVLAGTVLADSGGTTSATTFKSDLAEATSPITIAPLPYAPRIWLRSSDGIVYSADPVISAWYDRSGEANDAWQGTDTNRPSLASGVVNFDGTDNYMVIYHTAALQAAAHMTVAVRVRVDRISTSEMIITKSTNASGGSWSMQNASGELRFWFGTPGTDGGYLASGVAAGNWYTIVWVYDGDQTGNANRLKLWINGVQQTLAFYGTIPATTGVSALDIHLGASADPLQYFEGAFREVVYQPDTLTDAQVALLSTYLTDGYGGALINSLCTFVTGTLAGQVRKITGYDATTEYLSFTEGFTGTPAVGDDFFIVNQ
jgi:hypothetical protein